LRRLFLGLLLLALSAIPAGAAERTPVPIGFLGLDDDPRHAAVELYTGLLLRPAVRPVDGARTALQAGRIVGRALGVDFQIREASAADAAGLAAAATRLAEDRVHYVLLDLPAAEIEAVTAVLADEDILLFNVSAEDDRLRGEGCSANLFHTIPSLAMRTDALAQYLARMAWHDVLLLTGPLPQDEVEARSHLHSLQRFGMKIADARRFVASNDPRQRELNNIRLLTQGIDYDVVLAVDTGSQIARTFPYRIVLPRPVVGDAGLVPSAWHWTFERYGAPQLNQRFSREVDGQRAMADPEFAAWVAVRAIIEAHAQARSSDPATVAAVIRSPDLNLDIYKGAPASFRSWDNQLRQPMLLHTEDAVIERAPVEGFRHARNDLDTLGVDAPETLCRL
jgi:ABC transporter substrate binding protein (PQQ-dependent alcohol dehydrogenase system)